VATQVNHLAKAIRLRARAEECRRLAELVRDKRSSSQYGGLAESYERLANTEEALAEMTPLPDQPPPPLNEIAPRKE
jgi:hypothetical protein